MHLYGDDYIDPRGENSSWFQKKAIDLEAKLGGGEQCFKHKMCDRRLGLPPKDDSINVGWLKGFQKNTSFNSSL